MRAKVLTFGKIHRCLLNISTCWLWLVPNWEIYGYFPRLKRVNVRGALKIRLHCTANFTLKKNFEQKRNVLWQCRSRNSYQVRATFNKLSRQPLCSTIYYTTEIGSLNVTFRDVSYYNRHECLSHIKTTFFVLCHPEFLVSLMFDFKENLVSKSIFKI